MNLQLKPPTVDMLGTDVSVMSMEEVLGLCEHCIAGRTGLLLGVVNAAKTVNCRRNDKLRKSLDEADIVLADGLPVVWLSRLLGTPLPERVAGIDIMERLLEIASARNYGVFFLGAREEVITKVVDVVRAKYPGVRIAGYRNGYFSESEEEQVAQSIKDSLADILFVGMNSPKKECFLGRWYKFIDVSVCHGVGGSFDVIAGVTKRAPAWMQRCGLEWFYRLMQEPRRMWRRYLVTGSIFVVLSIGAIIRTRFGRAGTSS